MSSPIDLFNLDRYVPLNESSYKLDSSINCYGCTKSFRTFHPVYLFSCRSCGNKFQKFRMLNRNLSGKIALVIGARTKLGHQIVVKLLDAGATVFATTRYPKKGMKLFAEYPHWETSWKEKLHFYPLDLDCCDLQEKLNQLKDFVISRNVNHIDILINSAAQTIRSREKKSTFKSSYTESNRYGGDKFVPEEDTNSWHQKLADVRQGEMEEVYRINAIAPTLMIQTFMPLLKECPSNPYVINVHAREGLFNVYKDDRHIHTNMAKAALSMVTRCLAESGYKTKEGEKIWFHGIDPGWMSIDEYYQSNLPLIMPPLDEVDGAARVLYPVMANISGSFKKTRRHFEFFLN